jgi:ABC-type multidrug transport system ATPase subunit
VPELDVLDVRDASAAETIVAVTHLSRRFGTKAALQDVSMAVGRGSVFGLVGENGAGKSTLLKHLLGLWRAETGDVRVFGKDPVTDPVSVLGRIGYLSEQPDLPEWMRVADLLRYTQAFYPRWDTKYADQLREQFGLDPQARIKTLSKGQHARLGLIAAEAHRPDLLILDEPSSGLDPIVRRDILEAIIRTVTDEGRTVIFSSHLLDEVERVSDHLAMLHHGTLRFCAPIDVVKARHRRISLRFERPPTNPPNVPGALRVDGAGREWTVICDAERIHAAALAQSLGATLVEDDAASLDEIFIAHAAASPMASNEPSRTVN